MYWSLRDLIFAALLVFVASLECQPPPPPSREEMETACDSCLADDDTPIAFCDALCHGDDRAR